MKRDYIYIGLIAIAVLAYLFKPSPVSKQDLKPVEELVTRLTKYKDSIYRIKNAENEYLLKENMKLSKKDKVKEKKMNNNTNTINALSDSSLVRYIDSLRQIGIK